MKLPLKYEDLESALLRQNRLLKTHLFTVSVVMALFCFVIMSQRLFFSFEAGPLLKERALIEDVCKEAFSEIKQKEMSAHIIHTELIRMIEKEELNWADAEIMRVASSIINECHIIFKLKGKLRSFHFVFDANDSNPFFFRLIEINETEVKS